MLARATRNANVRAAWLIFIGAGYLRAADHNIRGLLVIVNVQVIAFQSVVKATEATNAVIGASQNDE
jgi:hypothetical protein